VLRSLVLSLPVNTMCAALVGHRGCTTMAAFYIWRLAASSLMGRRTSDPLNVFNPFTDEQLNLLGTLPKQVYHFSSLYIF